MTADFSNHENLKKKWMLAGICATLVIVLILPLSYFKSRQRINEQPDKDKKKFICPCHASQFDISGNVLSSPAPRALDLFEVTIVNKNIQVDLGKRMKRNRFNKSQLIYPETVTILEENNKK
jgi:hypothetical protein